MMPDKCYGCEYYDELFIPETGDEYELCTKPDDVECDEDPDYGG